MNIELLTEYHLEFLSLKGGCTGSSESTLVEIAHCWKSHVMAQLCFRKGLPVFLVISLLAWMGKRSVFVAFLVILTYIF